MGLVNVKCTNCGADLQADDGRDAMVCPYCSSAFVMEKAIRNFNITNVQHNTINADVVKIIQSETDFIIEAGVLLKYKGSSTSVEIPDGVLEIGAGVFENMRYISEIIIPHSVRCIRKRAFFGCQSLTKINYKGDIAGWCSVCKEGSFYDDKELWINNGWHFYINNRIITDLIVPEGVPEIAAYAFCHCESITGISLPSTLEKIGTCSFRYCNYISSVNIPIGVDELGYKVFSGCKRLKIRIKKNMLHRNYYNKKICVRCDEELPLWGNRCKTCGVEYEWIK